MIIILLWCNDTFELMIIHRNTSIGIDWNWMWITGQE